MIADKPIRVGIVGAGANTKLRHIPGLQAIQRVQIVGVCNRRRASSEQVARQFKIPRIYENWMELVSAKDIDAVVIGTWPYMHCPVSLAALAADKHVMCEARMAMNAQEARAMRDAAKARPHLVAQVVPSPITLRVDKTVKRLIVEGYLGRVLAVELRAGGAFLDAEAPLHWRDDFDLSGFNVMSLGIWYEAIMRWVGQATRVMAMGRTFVKMRKDGDEVLRAVRIPEHLDVIAEMECGGQGHFQVSKVSGLAGPAEVFLFGSEGTLRFCDDKLYGGRRGDGELKEIGITPQEAGGWRVEAEFIAAIRRQELITHTSFEDGVKYMDFTEAVARSITTGQAVVLPLEQ